MDLAPHLRDIPDFPQPGILFKDITPLLGNPEVFAQCIDEMAQPFADKNITAVVGIESRGFLFAAPLALHLGCGCVPIRKPGKLPAATIHRDYALEYGSGRLEIHADALGPGSRVLVVDDVLATGGTLSAAIGLCEDLHAEVIGVTCAIELLALGGRARLSVATHCLLSV